MANFYGTTRSNYFSVKDPEAFVAEMAKYPVEVITNPQKDEEGNQIGTLYGFMDADDDGGGNIWSYFEETEEFDDYVDIDWADVFKRHLQDDWVAIIKTVGAEKYRYLSGQSTLYNNKGDTHTINLDNIYMFADFLGYGKHITRAEY